MANTTNSVKENKWNSTFLWSTILVVAIVIGIGVFTTRMSDPIKVSFPESRSPDAVSYKLYIEEVGKEVTHDSYSIDVGKQTDFYFNNLPLNLKEGRYHLGIAVVGLNGFESSISKSDKTLTVMNKDGLYFVYKLDQIGG